MLNAFGGTGTNQTTGWKPEPNTRGTWTILSTSIITISLCAWTALHLNVPEHKKAGQHRWRKAKWLLLGLVAPETVAYIAWCQRREARKFAKDARTQLGQKKPESWIQRHFHKCCGCTRFRSEDKKQKAVSAPLSPGLEAQSRGPLWTTVHGFYATMGGFAMSTENDDHSEANFLPNSRTRATLTAKGLQFLLDHRPDLFPKIAKEDIEDKSKADGIKKTVVCTQAIWFGVNCVTRLVQSLPISLLELNAFAHACCTLLIYVLWWDKPLDVEEPTLVKGEGTRELNAYMWMASSIGKKGLKGYDLEHGLRDEFDGIWMLGVPRLDDLVNPARVTERSSQEDSNAGSNEASIQLGSDMPQNPPPPSELPLVVSIDPTTSPGTCGSCMLDLPEYPVPSRFYSSDDWEYRVLHCLHSHRHLPLLRRIPFPPGLSTRTNAITPAHLTPETHLRWRLAHTAIQNDAGLETKLRLRHSTRLPMFKDRDYVKARIPNHHSVFNSNISQAWLGFMVAGVTYGGLHLLAWDAPSFANPVQRIFWQVSASCVTAVPVVFAPPLLFLRATTRGNRYLGNLIKGRKVLDPVRVRERSGPCKLVFEWVLAVYWVLLLSICPLLSASYVVGRVYLAVECVINLWHLPEGAFRGVDWPGYVPHIA